jgi:hypothetical protein
VSSRNEISIDGTTFEVNVERMEMEVTSINRPDERWFFTDRQGHHHQWYDKATMEPMLGYSPTRSTALPTLVRVHEEGYTTEDGDDIEIWHYECSQCGEEVTPGFKPDDCTQMIPGIGRHNFYINRERVSREEFLSQLKAKGIDVSQIP